MQIRLGRTSDLPAVHDVVERAYGIYVERIGRRPAPMDDDYTVKVHQGQVFLADEDGVIGLIVLIDLQDHVLVENVVVDPRRQGTGVGRSLLAYAETHARRQQIFTLRLYTNSAMTENLALYARLGYCEDARRTEDGFERVFFSKRLTPREISSKHVHGGCLGI